jgi:Xaa-Pro dipeptidase
MNCEEKLKKAREILRQKRIDGWLLFDLHHCNDLACQFLGFTHQVLATRRFFYWIPAEGDPVRIVHQIEPFSLDGWPGEKRIYLSWQSLHEILSNLLKGKKKVAMEYSPMGEIPCVSKVDGGTIDLVRSFGVEVVSSGDFLPLFTAVLNDRQIETHLEAADFLERLVQETWRWIESHLEKRKKITEYMVVEYLLKRIEEGGFTIEGMPICGVNANSADPHYQPILETAREIRPGNWVLIDVWCKKKERGSIYADITKVAFAGKNPSEKQQQIFRIVRNAQKNAIDLIRNRFAAKKIVFGWEADEAARETIRQGGYENHFTHRTGHSIEENLHGSGAHLDNLEMHDKRPLLPGTCFSVEPGIYLPDEFGVRLETDILILKDGNIKITGGEQETITCLKV